MNSRIPDTVPDEQTECDSCGYKTQHLHKITSSVLTTKPQATFGVCDLCYATYAGSSLVHPELYRETGPILRHVNHVANVILERLSHLDKQR